MRIKVESIFRVIAFDLFGTLARSTYMGPKYHELLQGHLFGHGSEYVAAAIRGLTMNNHPMNQSMSDSRMFCNESLDEAGVRLEYEQVIKQRLGFAFDIPSAAYNAGLPADAAKNLPSVTREQLVECWKAENDQLGWIPGAEDVVRGLQNEYTAVVLISNITAVGMWAVYERLAPLINEFDHQFFSCNSPVAKPDPFMWQQVCEEYGTSSEFWMVGDDHLIDLVMPATMGWKTILVGGNDGVKLHQVPNIIRGEH